MRCCWAVVVVFMSGLLHRCTSIDPACECVVFQSFGRNSGMFTSPDFPKPYPPNKNCILYTFIAEPDEIIELTFIEFGFKMRDSVGRCIDFLRIFNTIDRPEVNEYNQHDLEFCGSYASIQSTVYSSGRSLIMEFHSDYRHGQAGNYTGFKGVYTFLEKNKYVTTGQKVTGKQCTYEFHSNGTHRRGRFFSPFYPQNYKPNSACRYSFRARSGERVKVVFTNMQLYHIDASVGHFSCWDSPDVITVYDGSNESSPVIGEFCGVHNTVEVVSNGTNLYVAFNCDGSKQSQGFAATYEFIDRGASARGASSTSINFNDSELKCNEEIDSRTHRNGTIVSPLHPSAYPADITCRYTFTGVGRERVQLRFLHLDLHFPSGDPTKPAKCDGADAVTVYIFINGKSEEIDTWCGRKLPPMLMSSQHKMVVEFRSYHSSPTVTGFKAQYSFVTDFGIHEGQQDNRGRCHFSYQSSVKSEGHISSPNFDGLYPRNTECHYIFFGRKEQRVHIKFKKFQVDGIRTKCDRATQSDYVSLSNFAESEDRKMKRLCGHPTPEDMDIWSDGPFFRVIFKSNEIYDSEGFTASYKFVGPNDREDLNNGPPPPTAGDETYAVHTRPNSGNSRSRQFKSKRSGTGGGLMPLAPFTSLTVICPVVISTVRHYLPLAFT